MHKRYTEHLRCARTYTLPNSILYTAIRKYGENNFSVDTIECVTADSQAELKGLLNTKEIFYVKQKNSLMPSGYNMTVGGETFDERMKRRTFMVAADGTILKVYDCMSDAERELGIPDGSVKRAIMSNSHFANGYFWYDADDSMRVGDNIGQQKRMDYTPVYQFTLDGKLIRAYKSITDACKDTGCDHSHISDTCSGKRNSTGGYLWSYTETPPKYKQHNWDKCRPVSRFEMSGKFIDTFPSATCASNELGLQQALITACCKGRRKSTGGYRWSYAIS